MEWHLSKLAVNTTTYNLEGDFHSMGLATHQAKRIGLSCNKYGLFLDVLRQNSFI